MTNGVSITICTHNGEKLLPSTIDNLNQLAVDKQIPWEVIIIDNNSTDKSAEIAMGCWKRTESFRIIKEPELGLIHARIRGIRESRYEYISFIDDDNWISPDWVNIVHDIFQNHPEVGICGGDIDPEFETPPPSWFDAYKNNYAVGVQGNESGDVTESRGFVWGAGISIRKSPVENLFKDGFIFSLIGRKGNKLMAGEDTELCYALRIKGWRIWYDKRLRLRHYIPEKRLEWDYLCGMYHGFGASHAILDIYQQVQMNRFHQPEHYIKTFLKKFILLMSRKKYFFSRKNSDGNVERLQFEFYRSYLYHLIRIIFIYKTIYSKIHALIPIQDFMEQNIYKFGQEIIFDKSASKYLVEGWSQPDSWISPDGFKKIHYTRALGKKATIIFSLNEIPNASLFLLNLEFIIVYIHPQKLKKQRIKIYLNNKKIADWIFTERGYHKKTAIIPSSLLKKFPTAIFLFKLPNAASPESLGDIPEKRVLSISLCTLQITC